MRNILTLVAITSIAASGAVYAAGDAAAGKTKAALCTACHGPDGNSVAPNFPNLAGQHASYTVKQLTDYQNGNRANATMTGMSATLDEQAIADIAAYYASQQAGVGEAGEDMVALGETIYRAGNPTSGVAACGACHGPAGRGNPMAKFPSLGGQHAEYTAQQLKMFRAGERGNDPSAMMRGVAKKMTDAEIEAVAQYVQGLR